MPDFTSQAEVDAFIEKLEAEMREAARKFEFEKAAKLRDSIKELPRQGIPLRLGASLMTACAVSFSSTNPIAVKKRASTLSYLQRFVIPDTTRARLRQRSAEMM